MINRCFIDSFHGFLLYLHIFWELVQRLLLQLEVIPMEKDKKSPKENWKTTTNCIRRYFIELSLLKWTQISNDKHQVKYVCNKTVLYRESEPAWHLFKIIVTLFSVEKKNRAQLYENLPHHDFTQKNSSCSSSHHRLVASLLSQGLRIP